MQRQISKITKVADGYQMMTAVDSKYLYFSKTHLKNYILLG